MRALRVSGRHARRREQHAQAGVAAGGGGGGGRWERELVCVCTVCPKNKLIIMNLGTIARATPGFWAVGGVLTAALHRRLEPFKLNVEVLRRCGRGLGLHLADPFIALIHDNLGP